MILPFLVLVRGTDGMLGVHGVAAEDMPQAAVIAGKLLSENGQGDALIIDVLDKANVAALQQAIEKVEQAIAEHQAAGQKDPRG